MSRQRGKRGRRGAAPSNVIELDPGLGAFLRSEEGRQLTAEEKAELIEAGRRVAKHVEGRADWLKLLQDLRTIGLSGDNTIRAIVATKQHLSSQLDTAMDCLVRARTLRAGSGASQAFAHARAALASVDEQRRCLGALVSMLEAEHPAAVVDKAR